MKMKTSILYRTAALMTALDCFDNSSRESRELIQKKMYLCQCFGVPIPFDFEWSKYGVFSDDLRFAANTVIKYDPKFNDAYEITPKEQKIIDYINDLELQIENRSLMMDESFFYRLLADMSFAETSGGFFHKKTLSQFLRSTYPIYKEDFDGTYAVFSFMRRKSFG